MTALQRIRVRLSEVRARLNEISGLEGEAFTAEIRAEAGSLQTEYADLETRHRAAIIAEGDGQPDPADGTGEGAELRALTGRARLSRYLAAAADGQTVDGAEAELRAAYDLSDASAVPWAAIAPPALEVRADAITPAPATLPRSQDEILARVFPASATAFLGVDMPRVGVGEASYPVLVSGQTPETLAKGGTVQSAAGSFSVLNLGPRRITARFSFALEDAAVLRGMESALREDLAAALADGLDNAVLNGDGVAPNVSGFFDALSMATEKCTLLAIEKCTLLGSSREGSGATGAGAPDGVRTPVMTLVPRSRRALPRLPGRRSGGWPWRAERGGASGSCCPGC